MKKKFFFFIFLFIFGLFLLSQQGLGYDNITTHPGLTDEMVDFYNASFDAKLTSEEKEWIVQGSIDEDIPPRWINHFYDPVYNEGWKAENLGTVSPATAQFFSSIVFNAKILSSKQWVHDELMQAKYGSYGGNNTWENAIRQYANGNKKEAYYILGHVLHLLEDKTVPDHTRNDTHAHEGTVVTSDGGSPYEDYGRNFNRQNLTIANELSKENKQLIHLSSIDDYFDRLAVYSNGYFFSEDTISSPKYANPKIIREDGNYGYGKDREGKEFPLVKISFSADEKLNKIKVYTLREKNNSILFSYFSRLTQEAVMSGAGVIELFHKEAAKAAQNKELIPPAPQVGWWQQQQLGSPILGVVAAYNDIKNVSIYTSAITTSFFKSLFASFSSPVALVAGLIPANVQSQSSPQVALSEQYPPALIPVTTAAVSPAQPQQEAITVQPVISSQPPVPTPIVFPVSAPTPSTNVIPQPAIEPIAPPIVDMIMDTPPAPVYHGSGSVTGVSPDAAQAHNDPPPEAEVVATNTFVASNSDVLNEETATTTDTTIATSTDVTLGDNSTTTDSVIADTATSTEPVITPPLVISEIIYPDPVVINEVAWMGTSAQANDEWIELYNKTNHDIDLSGWMLGSKNKRNAITLDGVIAAHGYFLLERTANTTTDQLEGMIFKGALVDAGTEASMYLINGTTAIDSVDLGHWPAGDKNARRTMERVSPFAKGSFSYNWKSYGDPDATPFAKDADGNDILGTPGRKNSVTGYYTPADNIIKDEVWHKEQSPYFVPAPITISHGAMLTIESGVVVKMAKGTPHGGQIDVKGILVAEGSDTEPIVFTSFLDDGIDGIDSNRDRSITAPTPADWMNVSFFNTDAPSIIRYAHVQYGGQGVNHNPNGWYPTYTGAVSIQGGNVEISDSLLENNAAIALYISGALAPKMYRNTIQDTAQNTYTGVPPLGVGIFIGADATAEIVGNMFKNNTVGIRSESVTDAPLIVKDNRFNGNAKNGEFIKGYLNWNLENSGNEDVNKKGGFDIQIIVLDGQTKTMHADAMPYIVGGSAQVLAGGTLIIEPGAVFKFSSFSYGAAVTLTVNGTLSAIGTAEKPIVFTAFADDSDGYDSDNTETTPIPGVWKYIAFSGAPSSDSVFAHAVVRYGGQGKDTCPFAYIGGPCMEYYGAVRIDSASPTIRYSLIENNLGIAIFTENTANPIIENSEIRNTQTAKETATTTIGGYGISIGQESQPILTDNTYANNAEDVVYRE